MTVIISGFLVWSAVKQVVSFRQRELALMRLAGASRALLTRTVSIECLTLGFVIALPASLVGQLLTPVMFSGLRAIGFFGGGATAQFGISAAVTLIVPALFAVTSGIAGGLATLSATRGDLLSAVHPVARRMSRVEMGVRVAVALVCAGFIATLDPIALGANLVLVLPLLVVVPLVAIAPLLVPAGAWLVGRLIGLVAPGPGILAAERASKDRVRFARLATPAIIAVGVLGGFLVSNAPDEQRLVADYQQRVGATAIASTTGVTSADRTAKALRGASATEVARWASRRATVSGQPVTAYFTDPEAFAELLNQSVTAGDLAKVKGRKVATSTSDGKLGQKLQVSDASGNTITLTVVAVLADDNWEGIWFNWNEVPQIVQNPSTLATEVFASPITRDQAATGIQAAGLDATVTDSAGYIKQLQDIRAANTYRSNVGIFGTIYLMCVISLFQSAVSSNVARRGEFRVLGSLGVGRRGVAQTVATETVIVQVVAGVLVAGILVALGTRFAFLNGTSALAAVAAVTPATGIAFLSLFATALVAQLVGTHVALTHGPGLDSAAADRS